MRDNLAQQIRDDPAQPALNLGVTWDHLLKSRGCSVVNLFPTEVHRVLNLFPKELIEGTPKDFPKVWLKMRQRVCLRKILNGAFNQLPREQIENS